MNFIGSGKEFEASERPALEQLVTMGYEYKSKTDINRMRQKYNEVVLYDRLEAAIKRLNPELDEDGVREARSDLSEDRYPHNLPLVRTNEKIRAKLISLSRSGGLEPVVVTQNSKDGTIYKTVKIFDFKNIDNNDFVVTNQFKVQGFKTHIYPDIVVFVNGIPLVIIECKDPAIANPIEQAYEKNLADYQSRGRGFERLFFYNHCMIATCGIKAKVGALGANINHYAKWTDSYPLEEYEVAKICNGRIREQEKIIAGLLSKRNLLNHLQNFVIYETINGKRVKKIAKHQQFRVVTKSFTRLQGSKKIKDKGGVIWHAQGSGKSLSMLWLASQVMYKLGNPPIVVVTDRKQLDRQIHITFKECGFPTPIRATGRDHLLELLSSPHGKTIMTIIDKFPTNNEVLTSERIICLVDEAHRTQFKFKASQMRIAMPNAVFFGFTGTPIDNKDRSSYEVFGPLIDKYGFDESQADGTTLPIRYEGRLPGLFIKGGDTIDQIFEEFINQDPKVTPELKEKLRRWYVNKEKIAEAPSRIERIALDIKEHYTKHIEPNEYKAMIAAPSREAAVIYKRELDGLGVPSKIIMTSTIGETGKDGKSWDEYHLTSAEREREAEKFKSLDDPTKILIVVDMLLVGYDVPICQVLYLDKGLREHNLLQAIARVNRLYDEPKRYGLIIDYFGVTKELQNALKDFNPQDIQNALLPLSNLLPALDRQHRTVMKYFKGLDRENYDEIIAKFELVELRDQFESDFKTFSGLLDAIMPDTAASQYIKDFKFAGKVRHLLRTAYDGDEPSMLPYAKKIQCLIDDHVRASDISVLIETLVSGPNFLVNLSRHVKNPKARAAIIKTRAIAIIRELEPNNPTFYGGLRKRLQELIDSEMKRRMENAEYLILSKKYGEICNEALSEEEKRKEVFGGYEATPFEFAVYGELKRKIKGKNSIELTKEIFSRIRKETELVGWKGKKIVKNHIKTEAYEVLKRTSFDYHECIEMSDKITELAVNNI